MTALNLATVFGPNILRPKVSWECWFHSNKVLSTQTADARLLMECNTSCTDFVCIAIKQHRRLFPSTSDERLPKRLR